MADGDLGTGTVRIRRARDTWWRRVLGSRWTKALAALVLLFVIAVAAFWIILGRSLPSASKLLAYEPPLPHQHSRDRRHAAAEFRA